MKRNESLFGQLKNGGLFFRHTVDAGRAFADVHIEKRPAKVHQSQTNSLCLLCALWLKISSCLRVFVAENLSIKNNKLCETKPISKKVKCL
jgi:hypothetical protein